MTMTTNQRAFGGSWSSDMPELIPDYPDWMKNAQCAGQPEAFLGRKGGNTVGQQRRIEYAKSLCAACEERQQCLVFASSMSPKTPGIWGGFTEHELRPYRRAYRRAHDITSGEL